MTSFRNGFADELSLVIKTGGLVEVFYHLKCFGIPTNALPLDMMGNFHSENHTKWYQNRKAIDWQHHHDSIRTCKIIEVAILAAKEEQITASDETNKDDWCIAVPRPIDVLMGRDKLAQSHTGNSLYQLLIDDYRSRYDACETRIEKTIIASDIVFKVKEDGGRFLLRKKGETNWSEVDDWVAREKVTNAFRGRRKTASKRIKRGYDGTSDTASKRRLPPDVYQP
jgi:hypothetical protein